MKYFREITPKILADLQDLSPVPQGTRCGKVVVAGDTIIFRHETRWEKIEVDADYEVSNLTTVITVCISDYWEEIDNQGEALQALPLAVASCSDATIQKLFAALRQSEALSDKLDAILASKYGAALQKLVDRVSAPAETPAPGKTTASALTFLEEGETLDECEDGFFIFNADGKFVRYLTAEEKELV